MVCDRVSPKGVAHLQKQPGFEVIVLPKSLPESDLIPLVSEVEALVVRSETKVTRGVIESAPRLRAIGRAGVGVDNVDVEAATQRGVVVMNTPGGNTISTAELAFSMLMALARKIPQAHASMRAGEWDRKTYQGTELYGQTLGILGLGRIGSEVARRAMAFGMKVLAYDPYLSLARAKVLQVEMIESLDDLYPQADFISIHLPMSEETRGLVDAAAFAKMKAGVQIINCARGGIVKETDLLAALGTGRVAGAALDVYEREPLPKDSPIRSHPAIIMTPHLGASTHQAQDKVGVEIAETLADFLLHGAVRNAVNLPSLDAKTFEQVKPYLNLGEKLGRLVAQLGPKRNDRLTVTYGGVATEIPTDPVTRAVLTGFLSFAGGTEVNQVNVRSLAKSLGLLVEETRSNEETDYNEWLQVAASSGNQTVSAGGTFFSALHHPRIVRLNDQPVEIVPEGVLLLLNNTDRPGMVGHIGTLLGNYRVNIATMSLHRDHAGGRALTVLNLDSVPPADLLNKLQSDPDITNVRVARLS